MMMKRCSGGHFYDSSKYSYCPYCSTPDRDMQKTVAMRSSFNMAPAPAQPVQTTAMKKTVAMKSEPELPVQRPNADIRSGDGGVKTVGVMRSTRGIDPVVGWLVCISGPSKGRDYRIKAERNFIGRDASMDIAIMDDVRISRENNAAISYEPDAECFMLIPGESHGLVYLNGRAVYSPIELAARDVIKIGQTELVFIPFCGIDGFKW